jgi:hypothetical protein
MHECTRVDNWRDELVGIYRPDLVELADNPSFNFGLALNSWPVVSRKMREYLEAHVPGAIQFLPFVLQALDPPRDFEGYCVAQVLRFVDCIDRKRTAVREDWQPVNSNGDFEIRWPVILEDRLIGQHKLFRIRGYSICIAISEELKESIQAAGFEGQRFDLLESS